MVGDFQLVKFLTELSICSVLLLLSVMQDVKTPGCDRALELVIEAFGDER